MIDYVIDGYGREAIARLTAAYRDGASDEEALQAATGVGAGELYAAFYAEFGVDTPTPVEPEPIAPSNVDRPPPGEVDQGGVDGPGSRRTRAERGAIRWRREAMEPVVLVIVLAVARARCGRRRAVWAARRARAAIR